MQIATTTLAAALTLAAAYMLYTESNETRRIEAGVQSAERLRERLDSEIAALRAERAHLARPARIEAAAIALGMRPAMPGDFLRAEDAIPQAADTASGPPR